MSVTPEMSRNAHPQHPARLPAERNFLFPCQYQSDGTKEPPRLLLDKERGISFENELQLLTNDQFQQHPEGIFKKCEKSKDNDDPDGERRHNPTAVSKASPLKNEDRSIPIYTAAISKSFGQDLKQSFMADAQRSFNNANPDQLQQLSFNERQSLEHEFNVAIPTPNGKKSIPDLKLDNFRGQQGQYIDCLSLSGKPTHTDSAPKLDGLSIVTVGDKPSDWLDPEKSTKSPPVDKGLSPANNGLPPAKGSVSCEKGTKDLCEGRIPTGGEAEGVGTEVQKKSSSHGQDLECSPSLDSSDTSSIMSSLDHDNDANSQSQGILLTVFGSLLPRVRLLSLLLRVMMIFLFFVPLTTYNSNHSLAVYSRHDLVLSTVSADLSCLPVCPTHQPKYSVSFLIQLHMKHKEKWPDSTETLPTGPSVTSCLKRFPSLDLPVCALNSESTEMATCLLTDSPEVPLCSIPLSVPTKSGHADITANVQKVIREFSWGKYSETSIIPTSRSVQCSKPSIHSDETLIWHTQYKTYPKMEVQYANAFHIPTIFFTLLCMSSLRNKPKHRTIVATIQHLSSSTKVRSMSANLPPDKSLHSDSVSSAESDFEPDSRSVVGDVSLLHPTTEHQSYNGRLPYNISKDDLTPKEDAVYMYESCDTQGALDMDSTEEPAPKYAVCYSTNKGLPHPPTEHQRNRLPCDTSKDNFTSRRDTVRKSRNDVDAVYFLGDGSGTLGTGLHHFTRTPDAGLVRGCVTPAAASETFAIGETSVLLPNAAHNDDDIQEGIDYYRKYRSEDDELHVTERDSFYMRKQQSCESSGYVSGGSSLLDPSEEHLSLTSTSPLQKTPDHTQEQTDGGEGGHGSGSGASCGSGSSGGGSGRAVGAVGGVGGGSEGGGSAGGSGGDGRDDRDRNKRDNSTDISTDCESPQPTPDKDKKKHPPSEDPQTSDSGYRTKGSRLLSTSTSAPAVDHIKPQQQQFEPAGGPPTATSDLPPNKASVGFQVPNEDHHFSPVSNNSDATPAHNFPPRERHNPPPFLNSYPSQEDVPVAPRAASPEQSPQEELQLSTEESGEQSGASEMVCPTLQRPPDCAGYHPVSSGGCRLETQKPQKPPYWKLIDGRSLVLETPGDNHVPPEIHDDDDPSQGQDRPPRRHHDPPPFLRFAPHEDIPVALRPAIATNDHQVEPGEDWSDGGDESDAKKDWSESDSSDSEEEDSGMGDSD